MLTEAQFAKLPQHLKEYFLEERKEAKTIVPCVVLDPFHGERNRGGSLLEVGTCGSGYRLERGVHTKESDYTHQSGMAPVPDETGVVRRVSVRYGIRKFDQNFKEGILCQFT